MRNFLAKRSNRIAIYISMTAIALFCIVLMAYPAISAIYSANVRSEVHAEYEEELKEVNAEALEAVRAAAVQYNKDLFEEKISLMTPEENGYYGQLLLSQSKVMCYIRIPKINVFLPVYHGIGTEALDSGAGHMPQSSLPVGGENTHAVISAHTGMASSPMFSDLELLKPGDIFQIIVLGDTLTYEVQSAADIQTVLPQQIDAVQIRESEDIVTLITCTPYGINSHRLLVTGHRIETPLALTEPTAAEEQKTEPTESVYRNEYIKSIFAGIGIGLIILAFGIPLMLLLFKWLEYRKGANHHGKYEQ